MRRHILLQHRQTKLLAQWDDIKVGVGLSITRLEMGTAEQAYHQRHGTHQGNVQHERAKLR